MYINSVQFVPLSALTLLVDWLRDRNSIWPVNIPKGSLVWTWPTGTPQ